VAGFIKKIFFLICFFILLIIVIFYFYKKKLQVSIAPKEPQVYMTVLVHGSFGSLLGLLSIPNVIKDQIKGSLYAKINKRMRKDPIFYKDLPMLEKGFLKIEPTFDFLSTSTLRFAVYPIVKSYELVNDYLNYDKEKNYFYTFGWSGYLSQQKRRAESIRLYNALSEEIERLNRQGVSPKVRLIAHSHGGNVSLNLGAIFKVLTSKSLDQLETLSNNIDERSSLEQIFALMKQLPNKEGVRYHKGLRQYDYVPVNKNLEIDELIMLGTPIQTETEGFCFSPIFKNVYNIYSEEDFIQQVDFVTTKKDYSGQTLSSSILFEHKTEGSHLVQAKIAVKWQDIISKPSHKELWSPSWDKENDLSSYPLFPIPIVVFTPFIITYLNKLPKDVHDIDVTLKLGTKHLSIFGIPRLLRTTSPILPIKSNLKISTKFIEDIKTKMYLWKPANITQPGELKAIMKYLL
jgi:hypothetical protein